MFLLHESLLTMPWSRVTSSMLLIPPSLRSIMLTACFQSLQATGTHPNCEVSKPIPSPYSAVTAMNSVALCLDDVSNAKTPVVCIPIRTHARTVYAARVWLM